jgi:hypothetical protein
MNIKENIMSKVDDENLYSLCKEYRKTMTCEEIYKIFLELLNENHETLSENDNFLNVADCLVGYCHKDCSLDKEKEEWK